MINIFGYSLFLSISFYITIIVGWRFYKLGFSYLKNLIGDTQICESTNRILLTGYYLLNLGYVALKLKGWKSMETYSELVEILSQNLGIILLTLCLMHYVNMGIIYLLRKNLFKNHKNSSV